MNLRRTSGSLALALAAATLTACTRPNPAFFDLDSATGTGDLDELTSDVPTTDVPTTDVPTTDVPDDGTGSQSGTSIAPDSTGGAVDDTEDPAATTGTGEDLETTGASTGEPALLFDQIAPEVAGCVLPQFLLLQHAGPQECAARVQFATGYVGGMIVDTSFNDAGEGRPALVYLRFDFPPELAAADLVDAELVLHVAGFTDAGSDSTGTLRLAAPFDPGDLELFAPADAPGLELPLGPTAEDEKVTLPIPPGLLDLAAPLHLVIVPDSDDGAVFAGPAASDPAVRPVLKFSYYE